MSLDNSSPMVLKEPVEVPRLRHDGGAKTGSRWCPSGRVRRCPRNCKRRVVAPFCGTELLHEAREGRSHCDDPQARRPAFDGITFLGRGFLRWIALEAGSWRIAMRAFYVQRALPTTLPPGKAGDRSMSSILFRSVLFRRMRLRAVLIFG